ncbi:MAG: FG-GAP-like repeat-containing protein, partial [Myxococcota bacterium]
MRRRTIWTLIFVASMLAGCNLESTVGPGDTDADASDTATDDGASDADTSDDTEQPDDGSSNDDTASPDTDAPSDGGTDDTQDAAGPCDPQSRAAIGQPSQSASWRYGGGIGYPDPVERDDRCMTVVSTKSELKAALGAAQQGDVVYVADTARIDLTGESLCIPGGVWLAGGRGLDQSPGALIYTTETVKRPILKPCGNDVRITGLRLYGADEGECPDEWPNHCTGEDRTDGRNCRDCTEASIGIQSRGHDRLEVDNCEIAGFSYAGVWLTDSVDSHIHHNYIHHTQRQGLGYGVVLTRGGDGLVTSLIEWNRFDYYRHAVAGSGEPGQDYHARHNLVTDNAIGHVFDMHGEDENTDNGSELAGGEMLIHDNTVLAGDVYAMVIRGRPQHGAWLYDNCLANSDASSAALQRFHYGNFYVDESPNGAAANRYGQSAADCEPVRWCYWPGGVGPQTNAAASSYGVDGLRFGDFDGDGKTDVFRADGSEWQWVSAASGSWQQRNASSATVDRLRFGDFDGDGRTDVFTISGGERRVSDGGADPWRRLAAATENLEDLGFGDFNGDGKTDLFRATGSKWQWSSGGTSGWRDLNTSSHTIEGLAFGDFDGDGKTDVFSANGSQWRFSSGGSSPWAQLNSSSATLASLRFGDFDGDGKTDVFRSSGDNWWMSSGGASSWRQLRVASTGA